MVNPLKWMQIVQKRLINFLGLGIEHWRTIERLLKLEGQVL